MQGHRDSMVVPLHYFSRGLLAPLRRSDDGAHLRPVPLATRETPNGQLWQPAALRARAPADRTEIDRRKHQNQRHAARRARARRRVALAVWHLQKIIRPIVRRGDRPRCRCRSSASSSSGIRTRSKPTSPPHLPSRGGEAGSWPAESLNRRPSIGLIRGPLCDQAHHHLERIGTTQHWKIGGLEDCQINCFCAIFQSDSLPMMMLG